MAASLERVVHGFGEFCPVVLVTFEPGGDPCRPGGRVVVPVLVVVGDGGGRCGPEDLCVPAALPVLPVLLLKLSAVDSSHHSQFALNGGLSRYTWSPMFSTRCG